MALFGAGKSDRAVPLGLGPRGLLPNLYDVVIFILMAGAFVLLAHGAHEMGASLAKLEIAPVTLDPANLPEYALRTTLRMFAAICASLVFTFVVATLAAKSRKAELVIVPALDILQSVPVLGFLTFTVVFFMGLFPGSQLGAECAAIFAIFTSQAWNMAFSFYQSLRMVPSDLDEVSRHFRLSAWLRFWRLEAPFAAPGSHLEHHDVDVGRLVLRRRIGSHNRRRYNVEAARHRLLACRRHRAQRHRRRWTCGRDHGGGDPRSTISSCSGRSWPGPTNSGSSRPRRSSDRARGPSISCGGDG